MKSLLLEAYVKGQQELLYVVPFVAKVLESSLRSMVNIILLYTHSFFKDPNGLQSTGLHSFHSRKLH